MISLPKGPKYKSRAYKAKVVRDTVSAEFDKWLRENERRRNNDMRKQCLKCTDIYNELLKKDSQSVTQVYASICAYTVSPARSASLTGVK